MGTFTISFLLFPLSIFFLNCRSVLVSTSHSPHIPHHPQKFFQIRACRWCDCITWRLYQKDVGVSWAGGSGGAAGVVVVMGSRAAEDIEILSPNSPEISAACCSSDMSRAGFEIAGTVTCSTISWAIEERRRLPIFCITESFRKTSSRESALYCRLR